MKSKFKVESGRINISDPCYDLGQGVSVSAKNGEWIAYADFQDFGSWGKRVKSLVAEFSGTSSSVSSDQDSICVDSGQAGIFDAKKFKDDDSVAKVSRVHDKSICEDEPWYSICCDRTLSDKQWGVIPNGCVSSSGFGDGCYPVSILKDDSGKAVRVEINFIDDEDDFTVTN